MRIDPASRVETEIEDLRNQVNELKNECRSYFKLIEEIRNRRDNWKQNTETGKYHFCGRIDTIKDTIPEGIKANKDEIISFIQKLFVKI